MSTELYTPTDIDAAHDEWGANCGPAALAAILGIEVNDVRKFIHGFRGYMNPTHMKEAIEAAGMVWSETRPISVKRYQIGARRGSPAHGVVLIQFMSPQIDKMPRRAQYKHTHWIGVHGQALFDVNSGWMTESEWVRELWPVFANAHNCTDAYCRMGLEIRGAPPCNAT